MEFLLQFVGYCVNDHWTLVHLLDTLHIFEAPDTSEILNIQDKKIQESITLGHTANTVIRTY